MKQRIEPIICSLALYAAVIICVLLFGKCAEMPNVWTPQPRQSIALSRTEYEVLYGGARFGGKSEAGRAWLAGPEYIRDLRYMGLVIRKNADDLHEWIHKTRIFYAPLGAKVVGNPPEIRFPSGALIRTGHLNDADAYEKYQGHEYQKILLEELTQIPRESDYERLIASCRSTIGLRPGVFATANPGGPGHAWVKQRFVDVARNKTFWPTITYPDGTVGKGRSRIFIPATADDNPIGIAADPEYVNFLESIKDPALRAAWRYGDWTVFSGQFFDLWNAEVHVVRPFEIPPSWLRFIGMDWGYSAPAAVVWVAVDPLNNHYVYREIYMSGLTPSKLAGMVINMTGAEPINRRLADPSIWAKSQFGNSMGEQATVKSIADQMSDVGLYLEKANNDRINGWQVMQELMYWDINLKPKFYVFENCENVIKTIPSQIRDDKNPEDLDTDGEDHAVDAIRYVAMHTYKPVVMRPEKTQQEIYYDQLIAEPTREWDSY